MASIFAGKSYTALVEGASGKVFANIFPAKAEAPYFIVALVATLGFLCVSTFPLIGLAFDSNGAGLGLGLLACLVGALVVAVPVFGVSLGAARPSSTGALVCALAEPIAHRRTAGTASPRITLPNRVRHVTRPRRVMIAPDRPVHSPRVAAARRRAQRRDQSCSFPFLPAGFSSDVSGRARQVPERPDGTLGLQLLMNRGVPALDCRGLGLTASGISEDLRDSGQA